MISLQVLVADDEPVSRTVVCFTHSYCPNCYERFVRPELEALEDAKTSQDRLGRG